MKLWRRIINAWSALLGRTPAEVIEASEEIARLKSQVASLVLDLQEAKAAADGLRTSIHELESATIGKADALDGLFRAIVGPLSQLSMQAQLMDGGRDISGRSVMLLARQIAGAAEASGLEPTCTAGEEVAFDPELCDPLSTDLSFARGDPVVVRFTGYRYNGVVLRKALVEGRG